MTDGQNIETRDRQLIAREQERVAEVLHRTLAQDLNFIAMTARRNLNDRDATTALREIGELADQMTASLRTILSDLKHPSDEPLRDMIARIATPIARRGEVRLRIDVTADTTASLEERVVIGRVVREAVTNAVKHATARSVLVSARRDGARLRVLVEDDGAGFDPLAARRRDAFGLDEMRASVENVSGTLHVESAAGRGTAIRIEFP